MVHFLLETINLGGQLLILFFGNGHQLVQLTIDRHVPVYFLNHVAQLLLVEKDLFVVQNRNTLLELDFLFLEFLEFFLNFYFLFFALCDFLLQLDCGLLT